MRVLNGRNDRCWCCHEYAPGGVCTRPHPDYSHAKARADCHIENTWRDREARPEQTPLGARLAFTQGTEEDND